MFSRRLMMLGALLLLAGQGAAASYARRDVVRSNLRLIRQVYVSEAAKSNGVIAVSGEALAHLVKERGVKRRSLNEDSRVELLQKSAFTCRLYLLPAIILIVLTHTRTAIRLTGKDALILLLIGMCFWFFSWPGSEFYRLEISRTTALCFLALVLMVSTVFTDFVRLGPKLTWAVLIIATACYAVPFSRIAEACIPKGYAYLEDYQFSVLRVSGSSTDALLAHEKLELRPGSHRKTVLLADGKVDSVTAEEIEALITGRATTRNAAP